MTFTVCFHGAESTGKSVLAERLSRELRIPWVPEYGRTYAEEHGTDFAMGDLLAIAEGQAAITRAALAEQPPLLILDTDQLMTAAWAAMLFGEVPDALLAIPRPISICTSPPTSRGWQTAPASSEPWPSASALPIWRRRCWTGPGCAGCRLRAPGMNERSSQPPPCAIGRASNRRIAAPSLQA